MIGEMDRRLCFGINPIFRHDGTSFNDDMVARMLEAHGQCSRIGLNWELIQPDNSSQWFWESSNRDAEVDLMYDNGIEIIGLVVTTPWWARFINASGVATGAEVPAARDPANKYFFAAIMGGWLDDTTIWAHGADARTIFPQKDVPATSGANYA